MVLSAGMFPDILATSLRTMSVTSNSIQGVFQRGMDVVLSVSAIVIAILWIPIAVGFFSTDEQRRFDSKTRFKYAAFGTMIYVLAVTGFIYGVFNFIATGV